MNIVHIITGLEAGGAEAVLYQLIIADSSNQHTVVSLRSRGVYGPLLEERGIQVIALNMEKNFTAIRALLTLRRLLQRERPDVVQTWMYHADLIGGLMAKMAGCAVISWGLHNSNLSPQVVSRRTRFVVKASAMLSRWIPTKIISCSDYASAVHSDYGYSGKKIEVIHNGYDVSRFSPSPDARKRFRSTLGAKPSSLLVGMVARWHPVKDHPNLFKALSFIDSDIDSDIDWQLVLAGDGLEQHNVALVTELERYNLLHRCNLLGQITDVPALLNSLDLHVLSSLGEAFPNTVAEAMACGVPCVVTDVGDAALIVDGTGKVVPPSNPELLGQAIHELLIKLAKQNDADKNENRRHLHEKISQRFSSHIMVESYNSLWRKSLSENLHD